MGAGSWLVKKLAWSVVAFAVLYVGASALGVVPDSMKETVGWFGDNFTSLASVLCFCLGCYVFLKALDYKKKGRGLSSK